MAPREERATQRRTLLDPAKCTPIIVIPMRLAPFALTAGGGTSVRQRWNPLDHHRMDTLVNIPPYPTDLIRLEIDGGRCSYFPQFDAVLLTGFAQVHPSGWPRYSQLEADSTGLNDDASPNFPQGLPNTPCSEVRPGPALSFFSDLLRPRTPNICLPDATAEETRSLSMSSLSPIPSPDASPTRLPSNWVWLLTQLQRHSCANEPRGLSGQLAVPSTLFRLPPIGWNVLVPYGGQIVCVPPGTICPASLFGLTHLDETALWRHGPITRLPVSCTC
ncbi:hypothetical protein D915_005550 [Fasciola hepatica]|uniref:Uncharacterized protein n=1 Tax=Fasciola hepatica TaxID=6192 RepID=A0A4E0R9J2_FASHE|nr:hypothetical protein D915_005550 [Fasciola hepatica]